MLKKLSQSLAFKRKYEKVAEAVYYKPEFKSQRKDLDKINLSTLHSVMAAIARDLQLSPQPDPRHKCRIDDRHASTSHQLYTARSSHNTAAAHSLQQIKKQKHKALSN